MSQNWLQHTVAAAGTVFEKIIKPLLRGDDNAAAWVATSSYVAQDLRQFHPMSIATLDLAEWYTGPHKETTTCVAELAIQLQAVTEQQHKRETAAICPPASAKRPSKQGHSPGLATPSAMLHEKVLACSPNLIEATTEKSEHALSGFKLVDPRLTPGGFCKNIAQICNMQNAIRF
jgi:hypothetical protein